jgi:hypothetical protein
MPPVLECNLSLEEEASVAQTCLVARQMVIQKDTEGVSSLVRSLAAPLFAYKKNFKNLSKAFFGAGAPQVIISDSLKWKIKRRREFTLPIRLVVFNSGIIVISWAFFSLVGVPESEA